MGAGVSSFATGEDGRGVSRLKPGLGDIPESCAATVLMYLTPPEICELARLNRTFRSAAAADFIWESKLPKNYHYLVDKLLEEAPENFSKREIYARLCRPIPIDHGTKEVWLEKRTGGICLSISSKALAIRGIADRRYWNYIPTDESRFHTVAYLKQIWWFEVNGEVNFRFPAGIYSLFFRLQLGRASKRLGRRVCNMEHVHGWDIKPIHFQLSTSDGQHVQSQCYLDKPGNWIHYHAGDFVVKSSDAWTKVEFSMTQVNCTHTKGGLCVDSAVICPSGLRGNGRKLF